MSAPTSAGRWAKANTSMVVSPAPGTAGSTGPRTANRHRRSRSESPPSVSASGTGACSWTRGRCRRGRQWSPPLSRNQQVNESAQPQSDAPEIDRDEFFIGWLPTPRKYARFLRPIVIGLLFAAGGTAAAVAFLQRDPGAGHWDADNVRTFDGV